MIERYRIEFEVELVDDTDARAVAHDLTRALGIPYKLTIVREAEAPWLQVTVVTIEVGS